MDKVLLPRLLKILFKVFPPLKLYLLFKMRDLLSGQFLAPLSGFPSVLSKSVLSRQRSQLPARTGPRSRDGGGASCKVVGAAAPVRFQARSCFSSLVAGGPAEPCVSFASCV